MHSDDKALSIVAIIIGIVILTLITSIWSYNIHKDYQISQCIQAGNAPLEVYAGLNGTIDQATVITLKKE